MIVDKFKIQKIIHSLNNIHAVKKAEQTKAKKNRMDLVPCWNLNLNNYPMLQWNIQGKHAGTTLFGSVNVKSLQLIIFMSEMLEESSVSPSQCSGEVTLSSAA